MSTLDSKTNVNVAHAIAAGASPKDLEVARQYMGQAKFIGYCQSFVRQATGGATNGASAIDAWNNAQNKVQGSVQGMQPGDLVYFTPNASNNNYGHTGIYCTDSDTEILTTRGWLRYNELTNEDLVASYDNESDSLSWEKISAINIFNYKGKMIKMGRGQSFSMLVTPDHKVLWTIKQDKEHKLRRVTKASEMFSKRNKKTDSRRLIPVSAKWSWHGDKYSYEDGARLGWFLSEGWWSHKNRKSPDLGLCQSLTVNSDKCLEIRKLFSDKDKYTLTENGDILTVYVKSNSHDFFDKWAFQKIPNLDILNIWSDDALQGCFDTLLRGDGDSSRFEANPRLFQKSGAIADFFQILSLRLGKRANIRPQRIHPGMVTVCVHNKWLWADSGIPETVNYDGIVWCPTTKTGFWLARRNGAPFITGNSGNGQFVSATDNGIRQAGLSEWMQATGQKLLGYVPVAERAVGNAVSGLGNNINKIFGGQSSQITPQQAIQHNVQMRQVGQQSQVPIPMPPTQNQTPPTPDQSQQTSVGQGNVNISPDPTRIKNTQNV